MKEEIEAIAKAEADQIRSQGKLKGDQILADAKNEAKSIKKKILDQAKSEAEKNKVREISRKKLSIKMDYLQTRESVIDEIFVEAQSQLQKFTKSGDYQKFLETLLESSAESIGGGDLNVHLRKEDKGHFTKESLDKIAKNVSKSTGVDTKISVSDSNLNSLGGLQLIRSDNRLFVDNTFESRLERKNEKTRVGLLELLS
jgi:vacuolar-type H+-ATPase subunit E/Vma4